MRAYPLLLALVLGLGCSPGDADVTPPGPKEPEADAHGDHRHHGRVDHRFEDAEAWARHFDSPEREQWQRPDEVVARLALADDALVADLGAGTGYFSMRLAAAVPRGKVFAIDVEADMVRYLGERAAKEGIENVVPVRSSAADPAIPEPVDVVFLCDVYHHVADRPAFFRSVRDGLRPGGRLAIVDFDPEAPEDAPGPPAAHRIGVEQMSEELAQAGFELVERDDELLPYQYLVIFRVAQ